jgi:hypothetical protein
MARLTRSCIIAVIVLSSVAGCGGGGGGSSGTPPSSSNVIAIKVDSGPPGVTANVNIPFVSVKICAPGSTTMCQTIDHILLDTASTGFRVMASVLDASMVLPDQTDDGGHALTECLAFVSGYVWGSVKQADVQLAGHKASSLPIQVVGNSKFAVPTACSSRGSGSMNTVRDFGANGVLGISSFIEDCGSGCARNAIPGGYYVCSGSTCSPVTVSVAKQVRNPVAALNTDNNGFVIEMAAVPSSGAATATGSLILGIATQANNAFDAARILDLDANGELTTTYKTQTVTAFLDTGSNGLFFPDSSIPDCVSSPVGWFCPTTSQSLSAVMQGKTNGTTASVDFSIANIHDLMTANSTYTAYANIGANWTGSFDWGMPFYYGRKVFMAIEQRSTPAGSGPYIAY